MATTKLLIRENKINSDGKCVIYIRYTHNEKSFLISTSEKIAPELWDAKNQKVKKAYRGFTSLNDTLESKVEEVNLIARVAKQSMGWLKVTIQCFKFVQQQCFFVVIA